MDLPLPQPPMESLAKALQVSLFSSLGYQHYCLSLPSHENKEKGCKYNRRNCWFNVCFKFNYNWYCSSSYGQP
ncbi:hypothetical protein ES319_D05G139700v1 [Gossypium barbadense]|uniref:Uncharacterized protein n=1 Tax=Gossypium barbadense TaxID=3634 RepID=A0A5J5RDS7_GOSBA|nr:hypothetical protein ES319_D05G139700v1 [Gossypium barbadense]